MGSVLERLQPCPGNEIDEFRSSRKNAADLSMSTVHQADSRVVGAGIKTMEIALLCWKRSSTVTKTHPTGSVRVFCSQRGMKTCLLEYRQSRVSCEPSKLQVTPSVPSATVVAVPQGLRARSRRIGRTNENARACESARCGRLIVPPRVKLAAAQGLRMSSPCLLQIPRIGIRPPPCTFRGHFHGVSVSDSGSASLY